MADDNIRHELWIIEDEEKINALSDAFNQLEALYIADGHHRVAAATRVAEANNKDPEDASQYFISVIFPDNELQILDYNRLVKDLNGLSMDTLLDRLHEHFDITPHTQAYKPKQKAEFGLYHNHQWYQAALKQEYRKISDAVKALDVSILSDYIIEPLLGIVDQRRDPRIDFVGGID